MAAGRVCFLMRLRPEHVDEYVTAHEQVWPEMLDALRRHGWRDYSLFVHRADALVIGVVTCEDFAASLAAMEAEPVNARWQAAMAEHVLSPAGVRPDEGFERLHEYFHLA